MTVNTDNDYRLPLTCQRGKFHVYSVSEDGKRLARVCRCGERKRYTEEEVEPDHSVNHAIQPFMRQGKG